MPLPTQPITNTLDPARLRGIFYGVPGAGKTTLAAGWYPPSNLIIDMEGGTRFLSGAHFVERPKTYSEFGGLVNELVAGGHQFTSVTIDTIDHLVRMADAEAGQRNGKVAAGLVEYGKGLADRDGVLLRDLTKLLSTDLGVILCAHPITVSSVAEDGTETERIYPRIEPGQGGDRLRQPIIGLFDFVLAVRKKTDESRELITGGHAGYETKRRVELPNVLRADARALHGSLAEGIQSLSPVAA